MRELFGLLTRIRVSSVSMDLEKAARQQYLFVIVGFVVGLFAFTVSIIASEFLRKDLFLVSGGIVLIVLYLVTGILHTEGLADFSDGVMAGGTPERKRAAMKDVHLGAAGVFSAALFLIIFFGTASTVVQRALDPISASPLPWTVPFAVGFLLSEMAGKLAINSIMFLGPSSHSGMGTLFVQSASGAKLMLAILIASVISFLLVGWLFFLTLLGLLAGYAITRLARRNFGGIGGDSLGAANEVGRLLTLLAWVIFV